MNGTISELLALLNRKKLELRETEQRIENELKSLREDVQAIERTISIYQGGKVSSDESVEPEKPINVRASELRGMTHMQALDYIADKNEGRIKTGVAKRLFLEAGLVKGNPRYIIGHIYHILADTGRYERTGPGEFTRTQPTLFEEQNNDLTVRAKAG